MNKVSRVAAINLLILALYTILIHVLSRTGKSGDAGLVILIVSVVPVGLHVLVNFILSIVMFIKKNNEAGKAFLLSSLLVLIIGFSTCWGSASMA